MRKDDTLELAVMIPFCVAWGKPLVQQMIPDNPDVVPSHVVARFARTPIFGFFVRESSCSANKLVNTGFVLQCHPIILRDPISTWIGHFAE